MNPIQRIFLIFSFFAFTSVLYSQPVISGIVTDEDGSPLIGANIIISKTLLGTTTNTKGQFRFEKIPDGNYQLEISMIGYGKEIVKNVIAALDSKELNIILKKTSIELDQLIITAS